MPRALSIERRETVVFSIIVRAMTLISLIMTMKMAPSGSVFPDVFAFVAAADLATSSNPMSVYDQEIMKKAQALLGGGESFYPYAYNAAATLFLSLIYLSIPVPVMFDFAIFGAVIWSGSIFVRLTRAGWGRLGRGSGKGLYCTCQQRQQRQK